MSQRASRARLCVGVILLLAAEARAQDAYLAHLQALRAHEPAGVTLVVGVEKTDFYVGELIPLQLSFTSSRPGEFQADAREQDGGGRLNDVEEFLVDPAGMVEDPLRGLPGESGGMGGPSGGDIGLSETAFRIERFLNDWVRFREPGEYRVAVSSRRVEPHGSEGTPSELVSNVLTLHITPAPAGWVAGQIAESVKVLDAPIDPNQEGHEKRVRAGRRLKYLDTPESAAVLVRYAGSGQDVDAWSLDMGILGSAHRKQILPLLEARLEAPEQAVSERFLWTLSQLAELEADGVLMDPYPKDPALQQAWQIEQIRRQKVCEDKRREYAGRLLRSLARKQPEARAVSMNTLLDSREGANAAGLPPMAEALIADFRSLPSKMQSDLLASRWNILRGPAMLPVLREIYAHPPEPRVDPPLQDTAVRRIYDLAPEEGRRIILAEMVKPDSSLRIGTLRMLPDRFLPDLNERWVELLEAGQFPDLLILRYATGEIVQRVEKAYVKRNEEQDLQKIPHCGGPLIYYFLQFDTAFGEKELRRQMDNTAPYPACYDIGFQFYSFDRNAYSPALERIAIDSLTSKKLPVKRGAAEVLGKYGSPAAEKPLWETLAYFQSWWKGREKELAQADGQDNMQFERALRIALGQADGWTIGEDGLRRLLGMCSSEWCKQEVTEWLSAAASPVVIRASPSQDGFAAQIAQYDTRSREELQRKMRQFPAGTVFRAEAPMDDPSLRGEVEQMVRAAGYGVVSR